jgi:3-oxoacyl-(acyl-carrier-protein) synthase
VRYAPIDRLPAPHALGVGPSLEAEDRFVQLGVLASRLAIRDSRLTLPLPEPWRAGLFGASVLSGARTLEAAARAERGERSAGAPPESDPLAHASGGNFPASVVAREHGMSGPSLGLSGGCSAGLHAFGMAFEVVGSGDADVMVAMAAEAPLWSALLAALGAEAQGRVPAFVPGEGAAALLLEDMESARRRGAHTYAEVILFEGRSLRGIERELRDDDTPGEGDGVRAATGGVDYVDLQGVCAEGQAPTLAALTRRLARDSGLVGSGAHRVGQPLAAAGLLGVVSAIGAMRLSLPLVDLGESDDDVPERGREGEALTQRCIDDCLVLSAGFDGATSAILLRSGRSHG